MRDAGCGMRDARPSIATDFLSLRERTEVRVKGGRALTSLQACALFRALQKATLILAFSLREKELQVDALARDSK